jgi:large subunit ribosomal protein L29
MHELKANVLRQLTPDEAQLKLRDLREELFNLRFRNAMRQLDNSLRIREVRRAIARIETLLAEHESGVRTLAGAPGEKK